VLKEVLLDMTADFIT